MSSIFVALCIKAAQIKGSGFQNPFPLEEAHFVEAWFFMEGNVLQKARQRPVPHAYPTLTNLPSYIKTMTNYPLKLSPQTTKIHYSVVVTALSYGK